MITHAIYQTVDTNSCHWLQCFDLSFIPTDHLITLWIYNASTELLNSQFHYFSDMFKCGTWGQQAVKARPANALFHNT